MINASSILQATDVNIYKRRQRIIKSLSLELERAKISAIIGPNGSGKTTLLTALSGIHPPANGEIFLDGNNIEQYSALMLAKKRAVLTQLSNVPFAISAKEIALIGREPFLHSKYYADNEATIDYCFAALEISHLLERNYQTLSGGEQQRVQIARTISQLLANPDSDLQNKLLLLDEPTNHLDIRYQYLLMHCLQALQKRGLTIVVVMHNINLTLKYAQRVIILKEGEKIGSYHTQSLLKDNLLSQVFNIDMPISYCSQYDSYHISPNIEQTLVNNIFK